MALLNLLHRAYTLHRSVLRNLISCNYSAAAPSADDDHVTDYHHAPGPVARLPPFVKVNSVCTQGQHTGEPLDWSTAMEVDTPHSTTEQSTLNLTPALSLRQAAKLPQEQPHYLLPCEHPRSTAQTMLKRQATLKMLEGNVPMEAGEETRWYGSTRRERLQEREWMMRRSRVQKGVRMLEDRTTKYGSRMEVMK